jgi:hypothetical protein
MRLELVLRGIEEKCPHNPHKISTFNSELVLRDIPGKSRQGRTQAQRFRWSAKGTADLDPAGDEVVWVPGAPCRLGLLAAGSLTIGLSAGALTGSYPWIGPEPAAADTAGFLMSVGHGDLSSPSHLYRGQHILRKAGRRTKGNFLQAQAGHFC